MKYPNGTTTAPRVSSPYGPRTGGVSSFHYGVDYIGFDNIHAIAKGVVSYSGWLNNAAGNTIRIDHRNGIASRYMHNAKLLVRSGQHVKEGQVIAVMGDTGNATGKCCHLEVYVGSRAVDPVPYLKAHVNTNSGDEEMIVRIKGMAGKRSGGLYLFSGGRRTFLGTDAGKGFPLISDEGQIARLFSMYSE